MTNKVSDLPHKYHFFLNPYPDMRFSKCPHCEGKTGQRKLPLLVLVDPKHIIAIHCTNRYCEHCDMLIGHKFEIERCLTNLFLELEPAVVGNNYVIIGTIEKKVLNTALKEGKTADEILHRAHIFKSYQVISMTMAGWFPRNKKPPVMPHPPSTDWVKRS